MLGNLEIAPQTVYAYLDTHAAVELSNSLGYSLSFTGYAFGAWLAEQCVFFCHRDHEKKRDDVRGVTFDSPGSLEYLEKLNTTNIHDTSLGLTHLDVVQYVSEPSFVNTFNKHLPTLIRVASVSKKNYVESAEAFFKEFVEKIPAKLIKEAMEKLFEKIIKKNIQRFSFYLKGLKATFSNNLEHFLSQFDPSKQELKKGSYEKMKDWPKTYFTPSSHLQEGIADRINKLIEAGIDAVPHVPSTLAKAASKVVTFFTRPVVNLICENLLSGVACIINLIIEFLSGNVNAEQCLDCFEMNTAEYPENKHQLFADEKRFRLAYNSHYRIQTDLKCFKEVALKSENIGSLDYYLLRIYLKDNREALVEKFDNFINLNK